MRTMRSIMMMEGKHEAGPLRCTGLGAEGMPAATAVLTRLALLDAVAAAAAVRALGAPRRKDDEVDARGLPGQY